MDQHECAAKFDSNSLSSNVPLGESTSISGDKADKELSSAKFFLLEEDIVISIRDKDNSHVA
jgi:hypothetical protein